MIYIKRKSQDRGSNPMVIPHIAQNLDFITYLGVDE